MKLIIASAKLAEAARMAGLAVQAHNTIPVLDCCRLTARDKLSIYGTDLDTGIAAVADCDVIEPGEVIIDAERLPNIAGKLRGDVTLTTTAGGLVVKSGRSRFTLPLQSLDDAPAPLKIDTDTAPIALSAAEVVALFAGAAAGVPANDKRIYLTGVALFDEGRRLYAVGADGVGLSYAATAAACPDLGAGVIVHRSTCQQAVELFGKTGATLRISKNLVELASDTARLVAKLVDAVPSAWRSMVPPIDASNSATVATANLRAALDRCFAVINNLVGDLAKRAPTLTLWWDAGADLRIAFRSIKTAPSVSDLIPAEVAGKASISVNPKLLQRLVAGLEAESVRLSTGGPGDPLRIDAGAERFVALGQLREFSHIEQEAA